MARKAAAGTGNIRKKTVKRNGKEYVYWEARYTAGYDPGTGKQIQRSITGKTQKEVAQKLKEATHEIDEGTYQEPSRLTVGEWLDIWQRDYMRGVKPATEKVYATAIRIHLKPALGAVKLQALHPHTIQRCINEMDDKYASGTVHRVYMVLHLALERAFQLNYIPMNPAAKCELPRRERKKIVPLDTSAFLKAAAGNRFETLFQVAFFTGMRQGELLGLKWECVDFERGMITIDKQLQQRKNEYVFCTPKSGKSRTISPAPMVMSYLKIQRASQIEQRLRAGPLWEDSGLVFTDELGHHLAVSTVFGNFKRIAKAIGAPEARFHDIRHTYAVNAIRAGDDIKTVQETLGHSSAAFTLDVYAHVTDEMKKDSAAKMEVFMKNVLKL